MKFAPKNAITYFSTPNVINIFEAKKSLIWLVIGNRERWGNAHKKLLVTHIVLSQWSTNSPGDPYVRFLMPQNWFSNTPGFLLNASSLRRRGLREFSLGSIVSLPPPYTYTFIQFHGFL